MKKALVTCATGPMEPIGELTLSSMRSYAAQHGYDLFSGVPDEWKDTDPYLVRYPFCAKLLRSGYDLTLWLDADVLIVRHDKDVQDDLSEDSDLGYVEIHVPWLRFYQSPNDGVLLARNPEPLDEIRSFSQQEAPRHALHAQAGLWNLLGINVHDLTSEHAAVRKPSHPYKIQELPYEWNVYLQDLRGIPPVPRFLHFSDRNLSRRIDNIRHALLNTVT